VVAGAIIVAWWVPLRGLWAAWWRPSAAGPFVRSGGGAGKKISTLTTALAKESEEKCSTWQLSPTWHLTGSDMGSTSAILLHQILILVLNMYVKCKIINFKNKIVEEKYYNIYL